MFLLNQSGLPNLLPRIFQLLHVFSSMFWVGSNVEMIVMTLRLVLGCLCLNILELELNACWLHRQWVAGSFGMKVSMFCITSFLCYTCLNVKVVCCFVCLIQSLS